MGNESIEYLPLISNDNHSPTPSETGCHTSRCGHEIPGDAIAWKRERRILYFVILLLVVVLLSAGLAFVISTTGSCKTMSPNHDQRQHLYSPGQVALEDRIQVFTDGVSEETMYQGTSEEADQAWSGLYNNTIMKIPRSEAVLLPNKTYQLYNDPGYYIVQLDVFHQLHCLDKIRQLFNKHGQVDSNDPSFADWHISHCIESIRQYIMCNVDISVVVWQWNEQRSLVLPKFSQPHTCSNFERLHDWVLDRHINTHNVDATIFVEDDLPDPSV